MSSGYWDLANVEITNGKIGIAEVWGGYAPGPENPGTDEATYYSYCLEVQYTTVRDDGRDNVPNKPHEVHAIVFLTQEQFESLAEQIAKYKLTPEEREQLEKVESKETA